MNEELPQDVVLVLTYLLPGFLSAWIYYGLTSHPKPSQFERTVQALIFTFIVQLIVPLVAWFLIAAGRFVSFREWDKASEVLASGIVAIALGALLAWATNSDTIHKWLRQRGFTTRTSHPSEWFCVFSQNVTFVVLHFCDGRRLYGWPKEWPIQPDSGQFYVMLPSWIGIDGAEIALTGVDGVLVNARDVQWVEFVKNVGDADDESAT